MHFPSGRKLYFLFAVFTTLLSVGFHQAISASDTESLAYECLPYDTEITPSPTRLDDYASTRRENLENISLELRYRFSRKSMSCHTLDLGSPPAPNKPPSAINVFKIKPASASASKPSPSPLSSKVPRESPPAIPSPKAKPRGLNNGANLPYQLPGIQRRITIPQPNPRTTFDEITFTLASITQWWQDSVAVPSGATAIPEDATIYIFHMPDGQGHTHFFQAQPIQHQLVQLTDLSSQLMSDTDLQQHIRQISRRLINSGHMTPAKVSASEFQQLQLNMASATGDMALILSNRVELLFAEDSGEDGEAESPTLTLIRQNIRMAQAGRLQEQEVRWSKILNRHFDIISQGGNYDDQYLLSFAESVSSTSQPGAPQIIVAGIPGWHTLLTAGLELVELNQLLNLMDTDRFVGDRDPDFPPPQDPEIEHQQKPGEPPEEASDKPKADSGAPGPSGPPVPPPYDDPKDGPLKTPPPPGEDDTPKPKETTSSQRDIRTDMNTFRFRSLLKRAHINSPIYKKLLNVLEGMSDISEFTDMFEDLYQQLIRTSGQPVLGVRPHAVTLANVNSLIAAYHMHNARMGEIDKKIQQAQASGDILEEAVVEKFTQAAIDSFRKQVLDFVMKEHRHSLLINVMASYLPASTFNRIYSQTLRNTDPGFEEVDTGAKGIPRTRSFNKPRKVVSIRPSVNKTSRPRNCPQQWLYSQCLVAEMGQSDSTQCSVRYAAAENGVAVVSCQTNPSSNPDLQNNLETVLRESDDLDCFMNPSHRLPTGEEEPTPERARLNKAAAKRRIMLRDLIRSNLVLEVNDRGESVTFYDNAIAADTIAIGIAAEEQLEDQRQLKNLRRIPSSEERSREAKKLKASNLSDAAVFRIFLSAIDAIDLFLSSDPYLQQSIIFGTSQALGNDMFTFLVTNKDQLMQQSSENKVSKFWVSRDIQETERAEFIYEAQSAKITKVTIQRTPRKGKSKNPDGSPKEDIKEIVEKIPATGGLLISGQYEINPWLQWHIPEVTWIYAVAEVTTEEIDSGALPRAEPTPESESGRHPPLLEKRANTMPESETLPTDDKDDEPDLTGIQGFPAIDFDTKSSLDRNRQERLLQEMQQLSTEDKEEDDGIWERSPPRLLGPEVRLHDTGTDDSSHNRVHSLPAVSLETQGESRPLGKSASVVSQSSIDDPQEGSILSPILGSPHHQPVSDPAYPLTPDEESRLSPLFSDEEQRQYGLIRDDSPQ